MIEQNAGPFTAELEARVSERVTSMGRRHGIAGPELDKFFWEQRWAAARGDAQGVLVPPNQTLTDVAAQLPAGTALDAGCGEGSDAIWLAGRGWTVTAVDFVAGPLARGRDHAEQLSADAAPRINWRQTDLSTWTPPEQAYDLVSAHYLHGVADRADLFRRLAAAVRPGGTLLIVGHHPSNMDISGGTMPGAVFFSTADVVTVLDDQWDLVAVDDEMPRNTQGHQGQSIMLRSAVVRAQRH
jgi:2-polyprenyl-3-methyl-5-hydroxy-6-metoxy-1,4-benzoquinol methylase